MSSPGDDIAPAAFILREIFFSTRCRGGWVDYRFGLDNLVGGEHLFPLSAVEHQSSTPQVRHETHRAITVVSKTDVCHRMSATLSNKFSWKSFGDSRVVRSSQTNMAYLIEPS